MFFRYQHPTCLETRAARSDNPNASTRVSVTMPALLFLDGKAAQQILPARSTEVGVGATTEPKFKRSQHLLNQKRPPSEAVLRLKMSICGRLAKFSKTFLGRLLLSKTPE